MIQVRDKLHKFVTTELLQKIQLRYSKPNLSTVSKQMLHNLFQQMIDANKSIRDPCKISFTSTIVTGLNYDYFPEVIKQKIKPTKNSNLPVVSQTALCSFSINSRNYEIAIVYENKSPAEIEVCFNRMRTWLTMLENHAPARCSQKMNIYLYLTDAIKELPKRQEPIEQIHANTAFTTSCKKVTEMNIFREEEWFKVFIHETFHNMGLDFSHHDSTDSNKKILQLFPIKCDDVRLYETYCEVWAEIINVMFLVYELSNKNTNIENMIKKVENALFLETIFSIFQCAKVLNFYGLMYVDLFDNSEKSHILRTHKYKEKTQAFSYYVLKCIYIYNIESFFNFCAENNTPKHTTTPTKSSREKWCKHILCFGSCGEPIEKVIDSYCEIVKRHYKDEVFLHDIRSIEKYVQKKPKSTEMNSLRMSLFG